MKEILDINNNVIHVGDTVSYIFRYHGGNCLKTSKVHDIRGKSVIVDNYDIFGQTLNTVTTTVAKTYGKFVKVALDNSKE